MEVVKRIRELLVQQFHEFLFQKLSCSQLGIYHSLREHSLSDYSTIQTIEEVCGYRAKFEFLLIAGMGATHQDPFLDLYLRVCTHPCMFTHSIR